MTNTVLRQTLFALAAVALASAFANVPASAQKAFLCSNFRMELGGLPSKPKTTTAATKMGPAQQGSRRTTHYQFRWWYD